MAAKRSSPASRIGPRRSGTKRNQRVSLDLTLTPGEGRQLKAAAERELRSLSNYVGWVVVQHLKSRRKLPKPTVTGGARRMFQVRVTFTPDEVAKLTARAEEQRRSVSSYVTLLVVEALGRK